MFDTIIIGGGPAGVSAAIYAARKKLNTLMISSNIGGQILDTWEIENYPGILDATGASLAQKFETHLQKFRVQIKKEKVINIVKTAQDIFEVQTETEKFETKTLILAMGKKPCQLKVPGETNFQNKGVTYCATCDGPLFQNKVVAIAGAGNAGLETAIEMDKIATKIYLIEKSDTCPGDPLLIEKVQSLPKIQILLNTSIVEIYGHLLMEGVKIKNHQNETVTDLKTNGIFVEIGSVPNTDLVHDLVKLDENNKIIINKFCQTNEKAIFACGDVTNVAYNQIVIACGEGAKAAISAFNYLAKK